VVDPVELSWFTLEGAESRAAEKGTTRVEYTGISTQGLAYHKRSRYLSTPVEYSSARPGPV